jgi:hypothetical protein
MMNLYQWFVWLHVLSAFLFFFTHGTSMVIAFMLPKEQNADAMKALLNITGITIAPLSISLFGLLITSVYMGISAGWWKTGWWITSFLIMIAMTVWMTWYGRKFYSPIRKALGLEYMTGLSTSNRAVEPRSMEEVYALVAKTNPRLLGSVGLVITALLLWLMRFKPF